MKDTFLYKPWSSTFTVIFKCFPLPRPQHSTGEKFSIRWQKFLYFYAARYYICFMSTIRTISIPAEFQETWDKWAARFTDFGRSRQLRLLIEQDLASELIRSKCIKHLNEIVDVDPNSTQGEMARKALERLTK